MPIVLDGTTGVTTPGIDSSGINSSGNVSISNADTYTTLAISRSGGDTGTGGIAMGASGSERFPLFFKSGGGQVRIRDSGLIYQTGGTEHYIWHNDNLPYETGNWTPAISTAFSCVSYGSGTTGQYIRVGDFVQCWCRIQATGSGPGSGAMTLTGIPFAFTQSRCRGGIDMMQGFGTTAARPLLGLWQNNTTSLVFYLSGPNTGWVVMTGNHQGTSYFDLILNFSGEVN